MRYGILFALAALTGCAHISHQDSERGLEVSYRGPAQGAVELVRATDPRPYELAGKAVDKGLSTSVRISDDGVSVSAGYGYGGYYPGGTVGGYAPGNVGYVPGQGFVTGVPVSSLTPLATTTVVTGVPTQFAGGAIVPCPTDRALTTSAEQAACAAAGVRALTQSRVK